MKNRSSKVAELERLELFRVALTNAESHPKIAAYLEEIGFSSEKLNEGKQLFEATKAAYAESLAQKAEKLAAYKEFISKRQVLAEVFSVDRRKAKVIFKNDPAIAEKLSVTNGVPLAHVRWIAAAKTFYSVASGDPVVRERLALLKLDSEQISANLVKLDEIEAARAVYLKEKGESQSATLRKKAAFRKMDSWMADFYEVARLAFRGDPQQLEAFDKVVKE